MTIAKIIGDTAIHNVSSALTVGTVTASSLSLLAQYQTEITTVVLIITGLVGIVLGIINAYSNYQRSVIINKQSIINDLIKDLKRSGVENAEIERIRNHIG